MRRLSLVFAAAFLATITGATAGEWRYCLATATNDNVVYLSHAFESSAPLELLTRRFSETLAEKRYRAAGIQCPRGDRSEDIMTAIAHLAGYQHALGNRVSEIDWP